jgi:hypothetical protein
MDEGNEFLNPLVWPAAENLLRPMAGDRLLDVACGNGVTSTATGEGQGDRDRKTNWLADDYCDGFGESRLTGLP